MIAMKTKPQWILGAALVLAAAWASSFADVTVKGTGKGAVLGMDMTSETTTWIKGSKMRSDGTHNGKTLTTIIDLDNQRMIVINHAKKQAEIHDLSKVAADLKAIPDAKMTVEVKPTDKTKELLGRTCAEYRLKIVAPGPGLGGENVDVVLSGPAWIAKGSPGEADYRKFYVTAAEKGLFFNHPAAAKADPARAKGTMILYRELAKAGVPYAANITIAVEGSGPMAAMMSKMGKAEMSSTVTEISTAAIPDSVFEVPAGYKTKTK